MLKKILIAIVIILAVMLISFGYFWYDEKQARVKNGAAQPTFPYSDYSDAELEAMYPQYIENTALTTQTPEETHRKFVEALKKGDFDEAVRCCIVEKNRKEIREGMDKVKSDGQLEMMIKDLDTEIMSDMMNIDNAVFYYSVFDDGKKYKEYLSFKKDAQGVWLIESL